ncbi:tetratricopeptide repeat protein [Ramlibacter agri]|nr:tetratricopeptide repeat protein [Ramlibacter agri]
MAWLRNVTSFFAPAPPAPPDWKARGNEALAKGDLAEAGRCYREAVQAEPADPLARVNLGFVLLEQGAGAPAAESLQQALALRRPGDTFVHEAQFLLGRAHQQLGAPDAALAAFEAAASAQAAFAEPLEAAVRLLHQAGRHEEALGYSRRLAALRPAEGTLLQAQELVALGRAHEAGKLLDEVLAQAPDQPAAWFLRGEAQQATGEHEAALRSFERAVALGGPDPDVFVQAANSLRALHREEEALSLLEQALASQPGHQAVHSTRAAVMLDLDRLEEAAAAARAGLAHHPQDANLHWQLANALLLAGDFQAGWVEHEWRWHTSSRKNQAPLPDFGRPRWTGAEDISGSTILLFAEQGFGDTIQFLRYVPLVAARAASVLVHVSLGVHSLVQQAGLPANCVVVPPGAPLPRFDWYCPLMSLPLAFGSGEQDLPRAVPYLPHDATRAEAWRARLDDGSGDLRVGLVWSGNPGHGDDRRRSIPLHAMRALETPGVRFVSLQPEVRESDQAVLRDWAGLAPAGAELRDFNDTAALLNALDLVITVDTSVAHLAGALGRPLWILLPRSPDWRWMLEREDSPWYPSARLLRQQDADGWPPVLARVRGELAALVQQRRTGEAR